MYKLLGGELSPYTAKVRLYLRYKKIPFEPVEATSEICENFIKPRIGMSIIPVLVTPSGEVIQDSNVIIWALEKWHPIPSVQPLTPKQRIVSLLFELFCDEWMATTIMHYRWSYPENMAFVREEFGRMSFPRKSMKDRCEAASQTYQRFKDMLPVAGITEKTKPVIEQSWKNMLSDLSSHFDVHPYLLGGRPCVGDFSLAGMAYAHLYRDPIPGYLMKTTAPLVAAWVEHMNGHLPHANRLALHHLDSDGNIVKDELPEVATEFCQNDDVPETLFPVLHRFFDEYGPILLSTKSHLTEYIQKNVTSDSTKLPDVIGLHDFTIDGVTDQRGIFPFCVWKWQKVTDYYQSLSTTDRDNVDQLMQRFPHAVDVVKANLNPCRVTRINNIVHAALEMNWFSA